MTLYVEIVFLSNFMIDAFLGALTLFLLKCPLEVKRIGIFSLLGAIMSAIYPVLANYGYLLKISGLIILPIFLKKFSKFKDYLITLAVFLTVTVAAGGLTFAFANFTSVDLTYNELTYGVFPLVTSASGLILLSVAQYLKKELKLTHKKNSLYYEVYILNDRCKCRCRAFYDSGNRVYANNGECVVIVSDRVYNMLMPAESEYLGIYTAAGKYNMEITDAVVFVLKDGEGSVYKVKAGRSNVATDTDMILHSDMTGD